MPIRWRCILTLKGVFGSLIHRHGPTGIPGILRVLARPADNVFIREYVEGISLPRAPAQNRPFYDRLMAIALALHERGITHNDLHKEANVIVTGEGNPVVIDFQLSLSFGKGTALFRLLSRFDRYHLLKNRRHRRGGDLTPEEQVFFDETTAFRRLHRTLVKKPMNLMTRRLFPRWLGKLPTDSDP